MLHIRLLGQFDVCLDGKRVIVSSRAGQSLLAYLVLTAGTPHRREKLAGKFWPDASEDHARRNLRQELWRIRKAISSQQSQGEDYLLAEELAITFNRNAEYWLDSAQMERPDTDLESLTSDLALYQGELLPGFYEDWVVLERERIQGVFEAKMEQLLGQLVAAERWTAVLEQAERWRALGSSLEPAYRALMLAYGARGDMAKVSSIYQRCMAELSEQFGLDPSAETRALYDGLIKGSRISPRAAAVQASGTITFLFTDIEESTKLLDQLGDRYAAVLEEHHEILRSAVQKWNGHEVDTQGDAFFVTFSRALDAVQCAAESQHAFASHPWPPGESVRVRMGLHTGEPLIASTGYVGMDVHRAARIGDTAYGGQVLLSHTTRAIVMRDLPKDITLRDLGEHRLKDLKYPTPIYQLILKGLPDDFPPLRTRFTGTEAPTPGEAPFKGLQYFDEADSDLFFGRELLTAKLIDRLHGAQFLSVIIGASGSGKSSLVRAGLLPALKKGEALMGGVKPPEGSSDWRVHVITPTVHPLEALATELTRDSGSVTAASALMDDLMQDSRSLTLFLARQSPKRHTLLILDQFEELFTLCRDEFEREAFIDNLLATISPVEEGRAHSQITLILTLRADFYAHLAQYPELRDAVTKQQEYIGPMTAEELRRAIEEPAKRAHWAFEPGLVDLILRDVGDEPGSLPLLSHALLETWRRRAGHTLTLKGYSDSGGVRGAIAHTAESVYQKLSPAEHDIARNIFLRLTELGEGTEDTRRRASFDELMSPTENTDDVRAVLNQLAEARLVTLGEGVAEVAHEALIREWPTLREWLNQDRAGLHLHRHLTETAHEWELLERDLGELYRGAHLVQAREWAALHPNALNAGEQAFLDASNALEQSEQEEREAQQRRELEAAKKLAETEHARAGEQAQSADRLRVRNRVISAVGVFALLLAVLASIFGLRAKTNLGIADQQRALAEGNFIRAEAQRLAGDANDLLNSNGSSELIALLSLRSMKIQYSPQGDAALTGAATLNFPRQVFTGDTGEVTSVAFSSDGRYILTGSLNGIARLWDAQTNRDLQHLTIRNVVNSIPITWVTISPNDRYYLLLNLTSLGRGIKLWDTKTESEILIFTWNDIFPNVAVFSRDSKSLYVGLFDPVVQVFDVQTQNLVHQYFLPSPARTVLYISPDGRYAVTSTSLGEGTIQLWTLDDPVTKLQEFTYGAVVSGAPQNVAISPDGTAILFGYIDGSAVLWDITSAKILQIFAGHEAEVRSVAFSPDGSHVLTGGLDKSARIWDVGTGREMLRLNTSGIVNSVAFSLDGKAVLTGCADGTVQLWDAHRTSELPILTSDQAHTSGVSWSAVAFSQDGKLLVTGGTDGMKLWDARTGQLQRAFEESGSIKYGVQFSPDGHSLLSGNWSSGAAILWDIGSGEQIHQFIPPARTNNSDSVTDVAFSPDGKTIVTATGYLMNVWDRQSGRFLGQGGTSGLLTGVAFSSDGRYLLHASITGQVKMYETGVVTPLRGFVGKGALNGAVFSPDGNYIATASVDKLAHLWEVESGKEIRQFSGHTDVLYSVAFSPDGRYLATASADDTARLWEVATGKELRRFTGHTAGVQNVVFSPDGNYLATVSDDGSARLWDVDYHATIDYLCSILLRDFTDDERAEYNITDDTPTCP